jgi:hypothetical protein
MIDTIAPARGPASHAGQGLSSAAASLPGGEVSVCNTANISDQPLNAWARPSPSHTSPLIGCPPLLITSSRKTTRPVRSMHHIVGGPDTGRITVHTTAFRGPTSRPTG